MPAQEMFQAWQNALLLSPMSRFEKFWSSHFLRLRKEKFSKRGEWKTPEPIINAADEQHDRSERDSGRARYTSVPELVMAYLECNGERVWAAKSRAATDVWLGENAAVLSLDSNGKSPCSPLRTAGRLLLTGQETEAETGTKTFCLVQRSLEDPLDFYWQKEDTSVCHLGVASLHALRLVNNGAAGGSLYDKRN